MFDNVAMVITGIGSNTFKNILTKLHPCEIIGKDTNEHVVKIKWANMRIIYSPNNEVLIIKNSIHKLFNMKYGIGTPDNSTDFTFNQFLKIASFISEIFETDLQNIRLQGRFEFGVNIEMDDINTYNVIERYLMYKKVRNIPFETIPPRNGKPKHRSCYLADYRIKTYHKNILYELGVRSEKDVMRYEIVTTELRMLRKITGLRKVTLNDLTQNEIWERLTAFILDSYDRIKKIPLIQENIPLLELADVNLYCNSIFYTDAKNVLSKARLKKLRKAQSEVYEKWDKTPGNRHILIRQDLKQKMEYLISS